MQVIVRDFVETDREALRQLFVVSRDAAFSWAAIGIHKLEDFDVSTAGERILVAEHSYHPIGFASVWQDDSFLHNLFVHPRYQGLGVGTMLLAGCDKYFSGTPTPKCLKANERAKQFYQSQGGEYVKPTVRRPVFLMEADPRQQVQLQSSAPSFTWCRAVFSGRIRLGESANAALQHRRCLPCMPAPALGHGWQTTRRDPAPRHE